MGCAKTATCLEEALRLHKADKIDSLFVLAPNGVHENWRTDEIVKHWSERVRARVHVHQWSSSKSAKCWTLTPNDAKQTGVRWHYLSAKQAMTHKDLSVVLMSYDSLMTEGGGSFARALLRDRRCMLVADESHAIKTPGARRTKRCIGWSQKAVYRRILTGTLVAETPFDVYTQLRFLDPYAWHDLGIANHLAFKTFFGIWSTQYNRVKGGTYQQLVEYRHLDLLNKIVLRYCTRYTKSEVLSHLPPKLYSKRYYTLTDDQRRLYKQLRDEFFADLPNGAMLSAPLGITRLLRLQQVCSGYLPSDDDPYPKPIGGKNPRVELLLSVVEELCGKKAIVWARYQADIDQILAKCREKKISAVRYDGRCTEEQASAAKQAWKHGDAQLFVANPAKGGQGITLTEADTMIYYNNSFSLMERRQSEDRFHRPGMGENPVQIIDLCARIPHAAELNNTVDDYIVHVLRTKDEIASLVMGDEMRDWI